VTIDRDEARIRVLPSDLIDRIAAGEVIERPASVVKELLENAIDAGARRIRIDVEGGGLTRLVIEDDGRGMSPRDARTSLLRHATSKLAHPDDLFAIRTLGFRGEALSSIASVSRLTMTTRRANDVTATRIIAAAGEVAGVTEVGAPPGTCIEVADLFYNTPARRKFMRSPATEQAHVVEAALRVVLGAGDCGVVVTAGARRLLDVSEDATDSERLMAALGSKVDRVFPFDTQGDGVRVSGYVTDPATNRADTKGLWFFVNGRYVRDRMLQRAALEGYRSLVERGRYPVCVVHIELAADAVDVNVHPQKLEVRFRDGQAVFRAVGAALTAVLAQTPWIQGSLGARAATEAYFERALTQHCPSERQRWSYGLTTVAASSIGERPSAYLPAQLPLTASGPFSRLRPIGEALGYVICEGEDELVLIDVKAAHQRIALERLRREQGGGAVKAHTLLFPETIAGDVVLEQRISMLAGLGFEIEPVGPGRFAVRTIPEALVGADVLGLVAQATSGSADDILERCAARAVVRDGGIGGLLAELDHISGDGPAFHRKLSRDELRRLLG
jgi:DNA mismatch repair protein MutL